MYRIIFISLDDFLTNDVIDGWLHTATITVIVIVSGEIVDVFNFAALFPIVMLPFIVISIARAIGQLFIFVMFIGSNFIWSVSHKCCLNCADIFHYRFFNSILRQSIDSYSMDWSSCGIFRSSCRCICFNSERQSSKMRNGNTK